MRKPINLRNLRYEVSCFVNLSMGFPHRILKMLTSGLSFVKPPVVVFLDNRRSGFAPMMLHVMLTP